jgi:integrase
MLRGSLKARRQAILKDCRLQSDEEFRTVLYSRSPKIRFHDLPHSAATLLLAQGISPRYVSELLAHSSVSFTLRRTLTSWNRRNERLQRERMPLESGGYV